MKLDPTFAGTLTDLLTEFGRKPTPTDAAAGQDRLAAWLAQRPQDRDILVAGLTRSLADPAYLRQHLRHLRRLHAGMLPYEDLIPDDRINRLLLYGPSRLGVGELAWLALSPEQLQALRDEISENLTRFWVEAVEAAMTQAARELGQTRLSTEELMKQIREQVAEKSKRSSRRGKKSRRSDQAWLNAGTANKTPAEAEAGRPMLYHGTWQVLDEARPIASSVTAVIVPRPPQFELRFLNAPLPESELAKAELRLVMAAGVGAWVRISHGGFRFTEPMVPAPELVLDGRLLAAPVEAPAAEPSFRVNLTSNSSDPHRPKERHD